MELGEEEEEAKEKGDGGDAESGSIEGDRSVSQGDCALVPAQFCHASDQGLPRSVPGICPFTVSHRKGLEPAPILGEM